MLLSKAFYGTVIKTIPRVFGQDLSLQSFSYQHRSLTNRPHLSFNYTALLTTSVWRFSNGAADMNIKIDDQAQKLKTVQASRSCFSLFIWEEH